jgi:hypothetical protein
MPRERFEPTISAFKRPHTVHALDRTVTVIGVVSCISYIFRRMGGETTLDMRKAIECDVGEGKEKLCHNSYGSQLHLTLRLPDMVTAVIKALRT